MKLPAAGPADDNGDDSTSDRALTKALAEKVDVNFPEASLKDSADFLAIQNKIEIVLDKASLETAVSEDAPVTFDLRELGCKVH